MIVKQYVRPALWAVGAMAVTISAGAQTQTSTSPAGPHACLDPMSEGQRAAGSRKYLRFFQDSRVSALSVCGRRKRAT